MPKLHDDSYGKTGCFRSDTTERTKEQPAISPDVDIIERKDILYLVADIPGVDESTLDMRVEENTLTIRAKKVARSMDGKEEILTEFIGGEYARSFTLSNEIDQANIEASLRDGVLRLTLPKSKEAQSRRIEVKAG